MALAPDTREWIQQEIVAKPLRAPKVLVGLSGRRYSGKTTAGRILLTELGYDVISLADAARQAYADKLSITAGELYDAETKEQHRAAFIQYCDREREKDEDVFIKKWCERLCCPDKIACDDPRLPNEREAFELMGCKFIRIKASLAVRQELGYTPDGAIDTHPTETYFESLPDGYFAGIVENLGLGCYEQFKDDLVSKVGAILGERRSFK